MPTDNSRMVFFPSMLAKYSTVGFVWRMLRRLPYSLPFPVLADGSTSSALLVVCKCRAFGQCVCLAVSMLFFAPVFTLIPGFGPQHRALFKFHTNSPWPRLEFIRGKGEALSANGKAEVQLTPR